MSQCFFKLYAILIVLCVEQTPELSFGVLYTQELLVLKQKVVQDSAAWLILLYHHHANVVHLLCNASTVD